MKNFTLEDIWFQIKYEVSPGIHTYHACPICGNMCRSLYCQNCWHKIRMAQHGMIIAVDFDGTVVDTFNYPGFNGPMPGVRKSVNQLRKDGHTLILNTLRNGEYLDQAIRFLSKERISFNFINESHPLNVYAYGQADRKVGADLYIDDRSIGFSSHFSPDTMWFSFYQLIQDQHEHIKMEVSSWEF